MIDFVVTHFFYWVVVVLILIGLYGMLAKHNLVKKLIGMNIMQTSVIMFYIASATKWTATVPIFDPGKGSADPAAYINPIPHTLMLTAIVVGVATTGVGFALLIAIYRRFKTLDEAHLLDRMQ